MTVKENETKLVTPYENPDLDGTACAFAYAEFLQKSGQKAVAAIFGKPSREAQFVLKQFRISPLKKAENLVNQTDKIVIVDASDTRGISKLIVPKRVIEIIDHRKIHEAHKFPNARTQIELVGSAATLIAEKFHQAKILISKEAAALLFSAIVSNTINFKALVTTTRDHQMADWLKTKFDLPKDYVHEMFTNKSQFKELFKWTFSGDLATFQFGNYSLGIAQLEMIGTEDYINRNLKKIKETLSKLKTDKSLNFILLTSIDLEKAFNQLVIIDKGTQRVLELALQVKFQNGIAKRDGILMRKEIVPLVKEVLESDQFR